MVISSPATASRKGRGTGGSDARPGKPSTVLTIQEAGARGARIVLRGPG